MKHKGIILFVFVTLLLLHQDCWNWDNAKLVFGFMPVGLAYHACYSFVAALFWGIVMKVSWPVELEEWANQPEGGTE